MDSYKRWIAALVLAVGVLSCHFAVAQTAPKPLLDNGTMAAPKPLLAEPTPGTPDAKPKQKPGEFPQEFVDLREKMKAEYNAWRKDDEAIQKECEAPQNPTEQAQCDKKARASQARLDKVHEHTQAMIRQIFTWRYKQRGLPPPDWLPPDPKAKQQQQNGQQAGTTTSGAPATGTAAEHLMEQKQDAPLLPQDNKPLPAGTF